MVLSSVLYQGSCSYKYNVSFLLISQQKHCVCGKFPAVVIKTPAVERPLSGSQNREHRHTYIHVIQVCIYSVKLCMKIQVLETWVFLLSEVQMFEVYTDSYSLAKSMIFIDACME